MSTKDKWIEQKIRSTASGKAVLIFYGILVISFFLLGMSII